MAREQWGSRWGFILAAAGSAIGLGNVWRFPYLVGQNGGAAFVIIYLVRTALIGLPVMMAEFAIGRAAQKAPVDAFSGVKANPAWNVIGWMATIAGGFVTLSFYNVVGGWTIKYMLESLSGLMTVAGAGDSGAFFGDFIAHKHQVVAYQVVFMGFSMLFVLSGIGKGIEKACKVMMPALFILLIVLIVRSLSLPGAGAGIEFYLKPDFDKLTWESFLYALGQSFFSLSLGLGIMLTYGSYLSRDERLPSSAVWTACLDTLIAVLAGFAIFPAVFAMGFEPGAGVGLTFITLPGVFAKMPFGMFFSFLFFLFLFFAAVTSSMSLMEVATTFAIEKFKMRRTDAVCVMGTIIILLGGYSAISLSGDPKVFGMDFFDAMDYLCNNILLPVGSFLVCIFTGWFWLEPACKELTNNGKVSLPLLGLWIFLIRIVAPVAIAVIFLSGIKVI
jgi:NSS family neurotransmitter:Na+ symporter